MTPQQLVLVQTTFDKIMPIAGEAAILFYQKLFELDPKLKPLFKCDMVEQGEKLMVALGKAIHGLNNIDNIIGSLEELGAKHAAYGVKVEDYNTVRKALIWTLKQGLDTLFTEDVENAWLAVYQLLSSVMKSAASKAA